MFRKRRRPSIFFTLAIIVLLCVLYTSGVFDPFLDALETLMGMK